MHLNDAQLLELDQKGRQHIDKCNECKLKAENIMKFRSQLAELPLVSSFEKNWHEIQEAHQKLEQGKKLIKTNMQLSIWRLTSFALAASLVAVILWPSFDKNNPSQLLINETIAALIVENNSLQKQVNFKSANNYQINMQYNLLKTDIQLIDQAIQRAYLHRSSEFEKMNLWQARQKLMKTILLKPNKTKALRI